MEISSLTWIVCHQIQRQYPAVSIRRSRVGRATDFTEKSAPFLYRLPRRPTDAAFGRTKQWILFPDTVVEKMWAVRKSSSVAHPYLYQYVLVIPFVLITV